MNKRIRELAEQATEPPVFPANIGYFNKEKFAVLVIKETIQVARAGIEFGDGMEDAVYKYFGVEE